MRIKVLLLIVNLITLITLVQCKMSLKQVIILNRHSIRTPSSRHLNYVTSKVWPKWDDRPGKLTAKGAKLAGYMGVYFAAWLKKEGILPSNCPTEDELYVYANTVERTIKSAKSFVKKGFPDCKITVHHGHLHVRDPLFAIVIHNTSASFKEEALDEMHEVLNSVNLTTSYEFISNILDYKHSKACKVDKKCDLARDKNCVHVRPGHRPGLTGPLKIGSDVIDAFLMQNYEGFPTKDVAWGMLTAGNAWQTLAQLNHAYHGVKYNTSLIAKDIAEPMVKYITNIFLKDENPKVTLLVGHDDNMYTVLKTLLVKRYRLIKQNELAPIGSAMVLQKWRNDETKMDYFKLSYVYQSTDQLRHSNVLSLEAPPQITILEMEKCKVDINGFCPWEEFKTYLNSLY